MLSKAQKEYLLPMAYNAALRAGAVILNVYMRDDASEINLKSDNTPITKADCYAHGVIRRYLSQTRIPLMSEEGREMSYTERKDWDLYWLVDPLDGTKEFLKGNGEFTVNIALVVNYKPCMGVVYVPYKNRMYFSVQNDGAYRCLDIAPDLDAEFAYDDIFGHPELERLPITSQMNDPLVVAVSRSHKNEAVREHIETLKIKYQNVKTLEHGSSYKLCMVAEGSVDYYPRTSDTYEWDTAAGDAIINEAGGRVISMGDGLPLSYNKESLVNPCFACYSNWFDE